MTWVTIGSFVMGLAMFGIVFCELSLRLAHNQLVAGSIPAGSTKRGYDYDNMR